jgi:hypothetical protein
VFGEEVGPHPLAFLAETLNETTWLKFKLKVAGFQKVVIGTTHPTT